VPLITRGGTLCFCQDLLECLTVRTNVWQSSTVLIYSIICLLFKCKEMKLHILIQYLLLFLF